MSRRLITHYTETIEAGSSKRFDYPGRYLRLESNTGDENSLSLAINSAEDKPAKWPVGKSYRHENEKGELAAFKSFTFYNESGADITIEFYVSHGHVDDSAVTIPNDVTVNGNVTVDNFPATQNVAVPAGTNVNNFPSGFNVNNTPNVSVTNTPNVSVTNTPNIKEVSTYIKTASNAGTWTYTPQAGVKSITILSYTGETSIGASSGAKHFTIGEKASITLKTTDVIYGTGTARILEEYN